MAGISLQDLLKISLQDIFSEMTYTRSAPAYTLSSPHPPSPRQKSNGRLLTSSLHMIGHELLRNALGSRDRSLFIPWGREEQSWLKTQKGGITENFGDHWKLGDHKPEIGKTAG